MNPAHCVFTCCVFQSVRLSAAEGMARLENESQWLEREYPDAAASLRKGRAEMFTVNRLGLSPALCQYLGSTNIQQSGRHFKSKP